ncbi:hypothetical protein GCM10007171_03120 [Dickeya fangzhongdai]|nr:hypothetical protein GCM10007171_03120 [Dickeya fangzhongdai]
MSNRFNTLIDWQTCTEEEQRRLLTRPAISASDRISAIVGEILAKVRDDGDAALREYSARFDKVQVDSLRVSAEAIDAAVARLGDDIKQAMATAVRNIETFHNAQKLPSINVETQPGVRCQQVTRPIASVGLYIPGGSAPLLSTVLMLATPARIAGCRRVILCSPPPIADEILYAAKLCGVQEVFQLGGAQAIAAMAFGTDSVPKVDKIFGPGNAYVTEAKRQISQLLDGAAIDMPAGPSGCRHGAGGNRRGGTPVGNAVPRGHRPSGAGQQPGDRGARSGPVHRHQQSIRPGAPDYPDP